jgi:Nucleotidyl transferase AbiEii toxin, Type IV TA system
VLRSFHESEAFRPLAFVGGTALRFLYNLPRFSEDLDFSLVSAEGYDGQKWMAKVKRDLALAGFNPEVTWNDRKVVHTGWVCVAGILHDAGLSAMPAEKLAIKLDIDYDLPSLLAGKLHAAITRKYAKGRDWYDLVWYLSQRPPVVPNLPLLQNALDQTQGVGRHNASLWRELVRERLTALNLQAVCDDVSPFLERPQDAALLTRDNLNVLLGE